MGELDFFFLLDADLPRDFALGVIDPVRAAFALALGLTLCDRRLLGSRDALSFSISALIRSSFSFCFLFFVLCLAAASAASLAFCFPALALAAFSLSSFNSFSSAASSGSSSLGSVQFSEPEYGSSSSPSSHHSS